MTTEEIARARLRDARLALDQAVFCLSRGAWPMAIRRSQEAVELALKGALRLVGVDVPRLHDVGQVLERNRGRFPADLQGPIGRLAEASASLREKREKALYGDEAAGIPPERLYDRPAAEAARAQAEEAVLWGEALLSRVGRRVNGEDPGQ